MALGSQSRLQPTLSSLASFAEQILGQLNFSCLVIFCFTDTLKLQFGICTIIAGSCWHLSEAHSMDCHFSHSCWPQPLFSVAATMGSRIIFKSAAINWYVFFPNPLCLQHEWGVKDNIQLTQTNLGKSVFLPQKLAKEQLKYSVSRSAPDGGNHTREWCFLKVSQTAAARCQSSLHATPAVTGLFHLTVSCILRLIVLFNKKRQSTGQSTFCVQYSSYPQTIAVYTSVHKKKKYPF